MKGSPVDLSNFMDGNMKQFVIPVYQRNYDWLIENCNQLYDDLVKVVEQCRNSHFFGSIVTARADSFGRNRLVIDGQQRLTTISLLLMAGLKAVKDGKLTIINRERLDAAREMYLMAKHSFSERKIKMIPIEKDCEVYDKIFYEDLEHIDEGSKLTRNFRHFYDLLTNASRLKSFDELLVAIEKLQIITIELEDYDDAQLIFESLNSTGLDLQGADQIKNYLFMSLSAEEQNFCFKEYWQKIETATKRISSSDDGTTMFLRDYLTIQLQLQRHVRLSNIYSEWKKYMEGHDRKEELSRMYDYSRYYEQATKAKLSSPKLSEKMQHICNIETDVTNVFFIQFLKYADENSLSEDIIYKVIDIIENYMARRIISNLPGNALTQVFCALHKDVLRSIEEYKAAGEPLCCDYADILVYHIMRRDGNYQLPRDNQFVEAIKTRDVYHMIKPFQIFLFERLENSMPGELNDVAQEMRAKTATIEHIMPQTLNTDWIAMLGSNHEEIKEKYLHTFANLTLTGINSELSNKAFETKREGKEIKGTMYPGYNHSKYRLTRSVTLCEKWTEEELEKRSKEIVDTFLHLYPLPQTAFKPYPKPVEEASLEDDSFSPTGRTLKGFRFFGKEYAETIWKGMFLHVVSIVTESYPDTVDSLFDAGGYFWTTKGLRGNDINYCTLIAPDKYLWTSTDNVGKLRCLKYLFEKCGIAESELVFLLEIENK